MKRHGFTLDQTDSLADDIISCRKCPRVLDHCRSVADKLVMRRSVFADQEYWGRPVPNFGSLPAGLLIVGLAPGAHGSNRTSRMFTGDDSGLWLYRALHKAGFASTAGCTKVGDNKLINCSITAVTHCAPPGNKPAPDEIRNCEPYLLETVRLAQPRVMLALGSVAWASSLKAAEQIYGVSFGRGKDRPVFSHGAHVTFEVPAADVSLSKRDAAKAAKKTGAAREQIHLLASYHVSRQNTNTGRLTEPMLDSVFATARKILK